MDILSHIVRELKIHDIKSLQLSRKEANFLYLIAKLNTSHLPILELGAFKGGSTLCFASGLRDNIHRIASSVFCVDYFSADCALQSKGYDPKLKEAPLLLSAALRKELPHLTNEQLNKKTASLIECPDWEPSFRENLEGLHLNDFVVIHKGDFFSETIVKKITARNYSIMFLDGEHSSAEIKKFYNVYAKNNLAHNGLVVLHDFFNKDYPEVRRGAEEYLPADTFSFVRKVDSIGLFKKR